ncbi:MAG: hypothetical protein FJX46_17545 [Alphaproteobacteria bacterium]|nr:hypothetical protein [Alphaproteobacteria bacterium]
MRLVVRACFAAFAGLAACESIPEHPLAGSGPLALSAPVLQQLERYRADPTSTLFVVSADGKKALSWRNQGNTPPPSVVDIRRACERAKMADCYVYSERGRVVWRFDRPKPTIESTTEMARAPAPETIEAANAADPLIEILKLQEYGQHARALGLIEEMAAKDVRAKALLAGVYEFGRGASVDRPRAQSLAGEVLAAADADGSPQADYAVHLLYRWGTGVKADHPQAFELAHRAALAGDALAANAVALMLREGVGTERKLEDSVTWFRIAAVKGNMFGRHGLGFAYEGGRGVRRDEAEAARWYRLAAAQGYRASQHNLAILTQEGRGVAKDLPAAMALYRQSADQGFPSSMVSIGLMLERGDVGARDPAEAMRWYQRAANGRSPTAMNNIAVLYRDGRGVPRDPIEAFRWFQLALANVSGGDLQIRVRRNLDDLRATMSQDQLLAAHQLVAALGMAEPAAMAARATAVSKTARSVQPPVLDRVRFANRPKRADAVAVVVGNARYQHGDVPDVRYAQNDAEVMRRLAVSVLGVEERNVIHVRDASLGEMTRLFGSASDHRGRLSDLVKPGVTEVLVYFSGHGVPNAQGAAFLLPVDADPYRAELTAYPIETLTANLAKLGARRVVLALEACFSGGSADGTLVPAASPVFVSRRGAARIPNGLFLAAAEGPQIASWDHDARLGLFTRHLVEGLAGAADGVGGPADGRVTLGELKAWLGRMVPERARGAFGRQQTPVIEGEADSVVAETR